jgi:hypothetical protein
MDRRLALALSLAALLAAPAGATTVRSLGVRELAGRAGFVFEGRALASEVRAGGGGAIRTCVRFAVLEVLKGPPLAGPLELCFAGGRVGARERVVHGMHVPEPGERGVYFVERLEDGRVHPLLGWDQGRFLVREGPEPEVTTADGEPVADLDPAQEGRATGPSRGVARGALRAPPGARGLSPDAFKARVRALLAEGAP